MNLQSSEKKPVHLQWDSGKVVVTPEDQDRFVMEAGRAIASCQGVMAFDRLWAQFKDDFLPRLHDWCNTHSQQVVACYVLFPVGPDIQVFLVGSSKQFDFALSDEIAALEMNLEASHWVTDIVQLPNGSPEMLGSFFNPAESLLVYGHGSRAQVES